MELQRRLGNLLECGVCLEPFDLQKRKPMSYHCMHAFCAGCIPEPNKTSGKTRCPTCQEESGQPQVLLALLPLLEALKKPPSTPICTGIKEPNIDESKKIACSRHQKRDIEFLCLDCKEFICDRCVAIDHHMHKITRDYTLICSKMKDELEASDRSIEKDLPPITSLSASISNCLENLPTQVTNCKNELFAYRDQLICEIKDHVDLIASKIDAKVASYQMELTGKLENLKKHELEFHSHRDAIVQLKSKLNDLNPLNPSPSFLCNLTSVYSDLREAGTILTNLRGYLNPEVLEIPDVDANPLVLHLRKSISSCIPSEFDFRLNHQEFDEPPCERDYGALYVQGLKFLYGLNGYARDEAKGISYFERAAAGGHPDAVSQLGRCYYFGQGVGKDYWRSFIHYTQGAVLGHDFSLGSLGDCFEKGEGVEVDKKRALKCFQKSAKLGNPSAMYNLGRFYETGTVVPKDYSKALKWYQAARTAGYFHEGAINNSIERCLSKLKPSKLMIKPIEPTNMLQRKVRFDYFSLDYLLEH